MATTAHPAPRVELDDSQAEVLTRMRAGSLAVLGAPGSGRTTTLVAAVEASLSEGFAPEELLVIGANRRSASALAAEISRTVGRATQGGTLGRTAVSVALDILAAEHVRHGDARPALLTGAQQDDRIAQIIDGYLDGSMDARGASLRWPSWFDQNTMRLDGFRTELRALIGALTERGLGADDLDALALDPVAAPPDGERIRTLWHAAAQLVRDYENVDLFTQTTGTGEPTLYDANVALVSAARLLRESSRADAFTRVRRLFVDDAQELTEAARAMIDAFDACGVTVVTFGDPDIATGRHHGGRPQYAVNWRAPGEPPVPVHTLRIVHRQGERLREVTRAVLNGVPPLGDPTRRTSPAHPAQSTEGVAERATVPSAIAEHELVAGYLRKTHLLDGIAWEDMAVIARSSAEVDAFSRALERAGVPTKNDLPVAAVNDATVQALLGMAEIVVSAAVADGAAARILRSPLYALDPLALRRLYRAAYLADLVAHGGAGRTGQAVLDEHLLQRLAGGSDVAAERALDALAQRGETSIRTAVRALGDALHRMANSNANGNPLDAVLFEAWADDERERTWRDIAVGAGEAAAIMNRRLDAVVALFDRAKRVVERQPTVSLSGFVAEWRRNSVVDDSLAARGRRTAVTVTTPATALGREWHTVVVVGVNEGRWPDLRVRDTLLGAARIDEVHGDAEPRTIIDRRAEVLHDEQRLFAAAVSRARERLLVTAHDSGDNSPSPFLDRLALPELVDTFRLAEADNHGYRRLRLDGLAAQLRRQVCGQPDTANDAEIAALARLASADVAAATPATWFGIHGRSSTAGLQPVRDGQLDLRLSPSGITTFKTCPVNWFARQHSSAPPSAAMTLGTILHDVAEHVAEYASSDAMVAAALEHIDSMNFDAPWLREQQQAVVTAAVRSLWDYLHRPEVIGLVGEAPFEFTLTRLGPPAVHVHVTGRVDRVEVHPTTGLRIVDFKTGTVARTSPDDLDQLSAYQLAHEYGALDEALGDDAHIAREGAALVYPRIPSGRGSNRVPWKAVQQPAITSTEAMDLSEELLTIAIAQAGYELDGDLPNLDRPVGYWHVPQEHCLQRHDACRLHTTAEVTQ